MSKIFNFLFGKGNTIAYAIITAVFTIVPESIFISVKLCNDWSDTICIVVNRIIICFVILFFSNIFYRIWRNIRQNVIIRGNNFVIQIEYGNLMELSSGKVVINFDECFTSTIGDAPSDIKAESLCGQFLSQYTNWNIRDLIDKSGIKPARNQSRYNHNTRYTPGTIILKDNYMLMAFAKLDENGRGFLSYKEYLNCLDKLWEQIDVFRGTDDVYIPILGSGIIYFDGERNFSQQELLDIMICSYCLSPKKIKTPNKLHIVCRKLDGFSINNAIGVA